MQTEKMVGVFDSGVGGLSVLSRIRRQLPGEDLVYVADSAYMPYGCKTPEDVKQRCLLIAGFLLNKGIKALVVACNTATSMAVETLRTELDIPVIGMEPPVKPAVHASRAGVVGVLATTGTVGSEKFKRLKQRYAADTELIVQPCPGLVERIEKGDLSAGGTSVMLASFLQPLMEQGMDTLVLGCTHYPFITPLIRQIIGDDISIVDTGDAIARELEKQLYSRQLLSENPSASPEFWSSGEVHAVEPLMSRLWGKHIAVKKLPF